MFGTPAPSAPTRPTLSLFQPQYQAQAQPNPSLLPSTAGSAPRPALNLFTSSTNTPAQQPVQQPFFGSGANNQAQPGQGGASTSLFANSNTAARPGLSLFGSNAGTAQPQVAQPASTGFGNSLFRSSSAQQVPQAVGLFGSSTNAATPAQNMPAQQGGLLGLNNLSASAQGQPSLWNPTAVQPRKMFLAKL
jgi:hypothetical protein